MIWPEESIQRIDNGDPRIIPPATPHCDQWWQYSPIFEGNAFNFYEGKQE